MRRILCLSALSLLALGAFAQETELRFSASGPEPVFRITSMVVEASGLSLTTDMTEVLKKMELLTLAPATIRVPNGDLLLSWGGTEDFSRTFVVRARGNPVEIRLVGNRAVALWATYAAGLGLFGFLASSSLLPLPGYLPAVPWAAGTVGAVGLVTLAIALPRVEVD